MQHYDVMPFLITCMAILFGEGEHVTYLRCAIFIKAYLLKRDQTPALLDFLDAHVSKVFPCLIWLKIKQLFQK